MITQMTDESGYPIVIPPKEAYYYFPTKKDQASENPKKPYKMQRHIFEGAVEYTQFEKEKLQEFDHQIHRHNQTKSKKIIFPEFWNDSYSLRVIQATNYIIEESIKMTERYVEWLKSFLPPILSDRSKEALNSGFIYVHGRDNRYRPIVCVDANVYLDYQKVYNINEWYTALIYMDEYVLKYLSIPGQVEQWAVILDIGRVSIMSIPPEIKNLMKMLQEIYLCRVSSIYVLGLGGFVNFLWRMIKGLIDKATEKKIKIISSSKKDLFVNINREQVEKKYGGLAPNVEGGCFFPPNVPSNNYLTENDDYNALHVSESQYLKMLKSNPKIVRSPYLPKKESVKLLKRSNIKIVASERSLNKHKQEVIHEVDEGKISFLIPIIRTIT